MKPSQAIILAAGMGKRIASLSEGTPKSLLKINDQTILERSLRQLIRHHITNITIVTGYADQKIADCVTSFGSNIHLVHNPIFDQTNNAYSLHLALQHNATSFILLDADLLFAESILINLLAQDDSSYFIIDEDHSRLTDEAMKVRAHNRAVQLLSKKMPHHEAVGEYIGMAYLNTIWSTALAKRLSQLTDLEKENSYYEDIINTLIKQLEPLHYLTTQGKHWMEIDTPEDYQQAQDIWTDSPR